LENILISICKDNDYILDKKTCLIIHDYLKEQVSNKDENFANGRLVRNLYDDLVVNHARRVVKRENPTKEDLSILEIYSYKDTFIIIARVGIVCLSQKDGSLIWKCNYYARTMEIVGHYGYVCTSLSFYRVDLDNGEKYGYGRKYDRLPDFEYNGENHWPSGHRVVYHKGLLWYDVHTSKHPFIIAIDPETGNFKIIRHKRRLRNKQYLIDKYKFL